MPHPNQYHQYSGQHRANQQPIITTPGEHSVRSRGHTTVGALDTHATPGEPPAHPRGYTTSPTVGASYTHTAPSGPSTHLRDYTTLPSVRASDTHTIPGEPSARSNGYTTSPAVGATYTHTAPSGPSEHLRGTTLPNVRASDTHTIPGEPSARSNGYTTSPTVGASYTHTAPGEPSARSRGYTTFPNVRASDTHTIPGEPSARSNGYTTSPTVGASYTHTTGTTPDRLRDVTAGTQGLASVPLLSGVQPGSRSHFSMPSEAMLEDLTQYITKDNKYPDANGGFGEIWKCTYRRDRRVTKVAVKSLTVYTTDRPVQREKKNKMIMRELRTCARLQHKHILPIYGYTYDFSILIAIVSPWAENGNLTTYLELSEHSGATLSLVRRFEILRDITNGLQYLHTNRVVHADLNGSNVLIYADGTACLADFGLSVMLASISQTSCNSTVKGNLRWMAPERLEQREDGYPVLPTIQSDIYSFGGVMLQVVSNKIPYYYLSDVAVMRSIITPEKPSRSYYPMVSDKHWHFIDKCWSVDDKKRPSTERVVDMIKDELDILSRSIPLSHSPDHGSGKQRRQEREPGNGGDLGTRKPWRGRPDRY